MTGWVQPAPGRAEIAPGLVLSDTWTRFAAFVLDQLVLFLATLPMQLLFGPYEPVAGRAFATPRDILFDLVSIAVPAVYFVAFWSGGRRSTPAQRLLRLQVANAFDGEPLSLAQAVRRWAAMGGWITLAFIVPAASLAGDVAYLAWNLVLVVTTSRSPTKQGLHDRFAGSVVVRRAGGPPGWLLAILAVALYGVVVYDYVQVIRP